MLPPPPPERVRAVWRGSSQLFSRKMTPASTFVWVVLVMKEAVTKDSIPPSHPALRGRVTWSQELSGIGNLRMSMRVERNPALKENNCSVMRPLDMYAKGGWFCTL